MLLLFIQGVKQNALSNESSVPSPRKAVLYKVAGSIAAALLYLTLVQKYSISLLDGKYILHNVFAH